MSTSPRLSVLSLFVFSVMSAASCGSSTPAAVGGFVTGVSDSHCHVNGAPQAQKVGMCLADTPGGATDGGAADDGGAPEEEVYPDPLYNDTGYDDDCKYQVTVASTPVRRNENVTFTVTIAGLDPAGAATNAMPYAEVTLGDTHVAPNTNTTTTETPAGSGIYVIGPIKFDRAGEWVVRFHMFGDCSDAPADSPHAHVAFRISVL